MEFEEGLKKLNEIKTMLEAEDVTIDESIKLYEESVAVTKNCIDILNSAEGKISAIKKEFENLVEKPLDEDEE